MNVIVYTGSTNFKHYNLKRHQGRSKHEWAQKKETVQNQAKTPAAAGDLKPSEAEKALSLMKTEEINKLKILFRNAHMVAKDALPFVKFPRLAMLDEVKGLEVGSTYRTDKKCSEFVHAIAEVERNKLRTQIQTVPFISIMCDGSTDSARREQEIVYVRYCVEGEVHVRLCAVKHLEKGDAVHIVEAVGQALTEATNLETEEWKEKLVGFASDGAAVMLGCRDGVATKLKRDKPKLVVVHCTAHRLELAFKDMTTEIEYYKKVSRLMKDLYDFYYRSPLNRSMLQRAAQATDVPFLVPTRVGGTRWVAHTDRALSNLTRAMPAILAHLEQLSNPDCGEKVSGEAKAKAKGFLKIMKECRFALTTAFLQDLFRSLAKASKSLQESNRGIAGAYSTIQELKTQIDRLLNRDGPCLRAAKDKLNQEATATAEAAGFRGDRHKIVQSLTAYIATRFEDVNGSILTAMRIVDFTMWPCKTDADSTWDEFGEEELRDILAEYGTILENAGVDTNEAEDEWTGLKQYAKTKAGSGAVSNLKWSSLQGRRENFKNILTTIEFILSLPSHSADCERGFSVMKQVKTDWRSSLKSDTLSDLMTVKLHSEDIDLFNPLASVNLWMNSGMRKRRPNYNDPTPSSSASCAAAASENDSDAHMIDSAVDDYSPYASDSPSE